MKESLGSRGPSVWRLRSETVACLALTHKTQTHGRSVFYAAWCCQPIEWDTDSSLNSKRIWMDGRMKLYRNLHVHKQPFRIKCLSNQVNFSRRRDETQSNCIEIDADFRCKYLQIIFCRVFSLHAWFTVVYKKMSRNFWCMDCVSSLAKRIVTLV